MKLSDATLLDRAVDTVTSVTETRADIALLVELAIDRTGRDRHIRVVLVETLNPLRRRKQTGKADVAAPLLLEDVHRGRCAAPVASIGSTKITGPVAMFAGSFT